MAIDFTGHSALPVVEAQRRIAFLWQRHPETFGDVRHLTDAGGLGPFGHEMAAEFGITA